MIIIGCDFHTRYQQIGGWHTLKAPKRTWVALSPWAGG
jgi:hypothetical protein